MTSPTQFARDIRGRSRPRRGRAARVLGVASSSFVVGLGGAGPAAAIVGGHPLGTGESPWAAELVQRGASDDAPAKWCGAVLIAPARALTAARCALGYSPTTLELVAGRRDLSATAEGDRIAVTGFSVSPRYNPQTVGDDVALVLLDHAVGHGSPVALADDATPVAPGALAAVAGWGSVRRDVFVDTATLHGTSQTLESDGVCRDQIGLAFVRGAMLCAAGDPVVEPDGTHELAGPCSGDLGAPLVVATVASPDPAASADWRLVGLAETAIGPACGRGGLPFVYAPTSQDAVGALAGAPDPPIQPYPTSSPTLNGQAVAGGNVSCTPAVFAGRVDDVDTDITLGASGGASTTYPVTSLRLDDADVGKQAYCESRASGPGGHSSADSYSYTVGPAAALPTEPLAYPVVGLPSLQERLRADVTRPTVGVGFRSCKALRCRFTLVAADDLPDNVASVLVRWKVRRSARAGSAWAARSGDGRWRVTIGPLPRRRVVEIRATALDRAGNRSAARAPVVVHVGG